MRSKRNQIKTIIFADRGWNFNPSASVMVYPEHTTNLVRGQGFHSNNEVLQRFFANNQHQQALNYFGFEGEYDPSCQDPGQTDRVGLTITYGDNAFENGFDYLYLSADHEQRHLANFKSNKYADFEDPLDAITHAQEEWSTYIYNYRRQGLYHKHGINLRERIATEGWNAGIYGPSVLPDGQYSITTFSPSWWHVIYHIPRLY